MSYVSEYFGRYVKVEVLFLLLAQRSLSGGTMIIMDLQKNGVNEFTHPVLEDKKQFQPLQ